MQFHGLCPFGLFRFTSAPTPAETAYQAYIAGIGSKAFSLTQSGSNGVEAKIYATAIQVGIARACGIEKAWNQQLPNYASDKLPSLESEWGVTVNATDSIQTQQQKLAAQFLLQRGARQEAIESALTALLGSGFYTLRVTLPGEVLTVPAAPDSSTAGSWQQVSQTPKYIKLIQAVIFRSTQTISYQLVGGSTQLLVGDVVTIDPGHGTRAEAITIQAVVATPGVQTLTATFKQPHDNGTCGLTCCPWWKSNQRRVRVIVTRAVSANQELRRQINEIMAKHMKSTTDWEIICVGKSSSTVTGPFTVGTSPIGAEALGNTAFTY